MKITILGCGSSSGVPVIGCSCDVCISDNVKNKRLRSSILIQSKKTNILVDTSPDLRYQALINNIKHIDAVIYTHAHADHIAGIDDLRAFNFIQKSKIHVYSNIDTIKHLQNNYKYIFSDNIDEFSSVASLKSNIVNYNDIINIGDIKIHFFKQNHGKIESLGIKINNKICYSTDVSSLPDESIDIISNIKTWIVDCISEKPSITHFYLDKILELKNIIQPENIIITHLGHSMEYTEISNKLPNNIEVAYDGMIIDF